MLASVREYLKRKWPTYIACSLCFVDEGLIADAFKLGIDKKSICPNCNSKNGYKLTFEGLQNLAYTYFVRGSTFKADFGHAPAIQFNGYQETSVKFSEHLMKDVKIFEKILKIGFFDYAPRLWMLGEIGPLKDLVSEESRRSVIEQIFLHYPTVNLKPGFKFYRIRTNPHKPNFHEEYDSPPIDKMGKGRLDSNELPVLYGSIDISTCIHECKITYEDELYIATLSPTKSLKLLDLSEILEEEKSEFESLDLAIYMLFGSSKKYYDISRDIAKEAFNRGFDGIVFPSYFSDLRTGTVRYSTTFGISHRRIPEYRSYLKQWIVQNIALFGRPIEIKTVEVKFINRLVLNRADYHFSFGPVYSPFLIKEE